jgi:hypothetical protein
MEVLLMEIHAASVLREPLTMVTTFVKPAQTVTSLEQQGLYSAPLVQ